jgi:arabinofuranosyltransferase
MPATVKGPWRAIVALLPPLVLAGLGWLILWRQGFYLVDDAYIAFRYVANFATGQGLVWNPGEPVEGYTNLLWVMLLTPIALLKLDLTLPAAILGTLAACGTLEVVRRIVRTALPDSPPLLQLLPPLLLATNPSFAFWSTSGMETPLFCFWVVLSIHLLVLGRKRPRYQRLAGITLAAGCLTRPEGLMVAGLALLVELLAAGRGAPLIGRLRRVLVPGLTVAGVVGLHLAFRLWYYGDPLPNTFYAKVLLGPLTLHRGGLHILAFMLAGGLLVFPGLVALQRPGKARPYLIQGYVLLATYLAYLFIIGGDHPQWYRFYTPLLPLPLVGLAAATAGAMGRLTARRRPIALGFGLFVLCALVAPGWWLAEPRFADQLRFAGEVNRRLYHAFFSRQVPPQSYVAAAAVGMLGYYTRYRILDTWGLNDRHIAHAPADPIPHGKFAHDRVDWNYVFEQRPDFIVTFGRARLGELKGYDICWPSHLPLSLAIYRRNVPLTEEQRSLGMPAGRKRAMILPPGCVFPLRPGWPPRQRARFATTSR